MTKTDYAVRAAFCVLAAALAAGALALTLMMNSALGTSFGATADGQFIQSKSLMLIDGMGVIMTIGAGLCLRHRKAMLPLVGILALAFGTYSLTGIVGFGAKERIAKSQAMAKAQSKNDAAIAEANAQALKDHNELLSWFKSSAVESGGRVERGQFADRAIQIAKTPINVVHYDEANEVPPDAQAQILTDVWNAIWFLPTVATDKMQFGLILALGILLKVAEMSGFFVASALWPERKKEGGRIEKPEAKSPPASVSPSVTALEAHMAKTAPAVTPAVKPVSLAVAAKETDVKRADPAVDLAYHRDLALVRRFREEMMQKAPKHQASRADEVFQSFRSWARGAAGATGDMKQARFGALLADLGVEKFKKRGYVNYRGVTLAHAA